MLPYFRVTGNSSAAHGEDAPATHQARTEGLNTVLVACPPHRSAPTFDRLKIVTVAAS